MAGSIKKTEGDAEALMKAIKERRSIRKYADKAISKAAAEKLKESLIWAPSTGNIQARKFFFVYDKAKREKLAHAAKGQIFVGDAPLCVVACADDNLVMKMRYGDNAAKYATQDVAASIQNMLLAAHALGLGACWVGAFEEGEVKKILGLRDNLRPVALVPVGYPAFNPPAPKRVSVEEACKDI